ncbi:MAG: helix-turn-helix domain-containing protein [Vicinamibacterales bacterium]
MADASTSPFLTPEQAGALLHIHPRTLANWRWSGRGPRYVRIGARAFYRHADLDEWLASRCFSHTAQELGAGRSTARQKA